ncbi:surface attachment protein Sap1 [Paraburkholderia sp. EG287B]|uniref:surface attachment protein Sap1 n=1 Tax=Paraburkholderia sp. EG287B TaxID=3237010 RepID=UPI0034D38EE0
MKTLTGVVVAAASLACVVAVQAQDVSVKPQQTVQLKPGSYGCLTKDKLDAVALHEQAGEHQQMQEYFTGFQCLSTPENQSFRVVQVVGHDVEFVNAANGDEQGLWTTDRFIKQ